jgi:hypothetical protein
MNKSWALRTTFLLFVVHVALWSLWIDYRFAFGLRLPRGLVEFSLDVLRKSQIEDIPDAIALTTLYMGGVLSLLGGGIAAGAQTVSKKAKA